jgi:hypothetical protein
LVVKAWADISAPRGRQTGAEARLDDGLLAIPFKRLRRSVNIEHRRGNKYKKQEKFSSRLILSQSLFRVSS